MTLSILKFLGFHNRSKTVSIVIECNSLVAAAILLLCAIVHRILSVVENFFLTGSHMEARVDTGSLPSPSGPSVTISKSSTMSWKDCIKDQLQLRNKQQTDAFAALIYHHNRIFESYDTLKVENISLNVANEKLRQENVQLQISGGGSDSPGRPNEQSQILERKLFKLQEEVTELLKTKSDNAQQVINLTAVLQERDAEIRKKDALMDSQASEIARLRKELEQVKEALASVESANALLQDEYNSLHMAFTRTELNLRQLQEENADLVARWMKSKALDADKLNAENEEALKLKNEKLQRELEEAAKEVRIRVREEEGEAAAEALPAVGFFATTCPVPVRACQKWDAHDSDINALAWTSSGSVLVSGGGDKKIRMWNITKTGEYEAKGVLTGSNASIMSLDFNTEESFLLAGSSDYACRVWTPNDQRLRHTLTGHSGKIMAAKFMGGGGGASKVVSGSHDRTIKIWDLRSRACSSTIFAASLCNDLVATESLATSIVSGHFDRKVRFWDTRNTKTPASELAFQGKVTSVSLSRDVKYLLVCVRDDSLKLLDLLMNQVVNTFSADGFHVSCDWTRAALSPDSTLIAAGSSDGSVFVWNVGNAKLEKHLKEHETSVIACSWSPTGEFLATCDKNKKIVLWSPI